MIVGVFGEAKFNRANQALRFFVTILVHVPALRDEPVLELVQGHLASQVAGEAFAYLRHGNHGG